MKVTTFYITKKVMLSSLVLMLSILVLIQSILVLVVSSLSQQGFIPFDNNILNINRDHHGNKAIC